MIRKTGYQETGYREIRTSGNEKKGLPDNLVFWF